MYKYRSNFGERTCRLIDKMNFKMCKQINNAIITPEDGTIEVEIKKMMKNCNGDSKR